MAFTPQQHREYREKLRAEGLCTVCHKREVEKGRYVCNKCSTKNRIRRDIYRQDKIRCSDCCSIMDDKKHRRCKRCNARATEIRNEKRANKNLCMRCFRELDEYSKLIGMSECHYCKEKGNINKRRRYEAQKG